MIYDRILTIYDLPSGTPLQRKLKYSATHYYAPREVYHKRYWESVQAGSRIDCLVEVPYGEEITATQYCVLDDGHVYRVEQAQHGFDVDGLPVTTLSLKRMEDNYDFAGA